MDDSHVNKHITKLTKTKKGTSILIGDNFLRIAPKTENKKKKWRQKTLPQTIKKLRQIVKLTKTKKGTSILIGDDFLRIAKKKKVATKKTAPN
jgi:hypothetical protein